MLSLSFLFKKCTLLSGPVLIPVVITAGFSAKLQDVSIKYGRNRK